MKSKIAKNHFRSCCIAQAHRKLRENRAIKAHQSCLGSELNH
jgi:hypothetical protein